MSLPLLEPTYSVSQLCGEVREFLGEAFSSVWVVGEAQRVRPSARGHVYFELVEKGDHDEIVGKLDAVIWKNDALKINRLLAASEQRLADGVQVRCRGSLDFYAPSGRLQLCIREVDPAFTLGLLERRRRETLAALAAAGLLEKNRGLSLCDLPLTIGLITSYKSAAYEDFLSGL
ncbi:MAG TPA: exodeoxyribonuclease VII large subunit, partial [Thermoanaerobaculia bacterium]|nr:exodeoxyribonuclease VII large subunit [Thermoanaerobaculia bacterium]